MTSPLLSPSPPPSHQAIAPLWRRLLLHAWQQARKEGGLDGLRVLLKAARVLLQRRLHDELFRLAAYARQIAADPGADALFYVSHRHFLARGLDSATRLRCAIDHFRFSQQLLPEALCSHLSRSTGLLLWACDTAGPRYELRWQLTPCPTRHEGVLSLVLDAAGERLHTLSFVWVEPARLAAPAGLGPVLFLTRNQSLPPTAAALCRFRSDFPQNSPAYFCLAAAHGLARTLGQTHLVGVRGSAQVAFEDALASSFEQAYDALWLAMGGQPLGALALQMPVPPQLPALESLPAKRRSRARARRAHWREIGEATQAALAAQFVGG